MRWWILSPCWALILQLHFATPVMALTLGKPPTVENLLGIASGSIQTSGGRKSVKKTSAAAAAGPPSAAAAELQEKYTAALAERAAAATTLLERQKEEHWKSLLAEKPPTDALEFMRVVIAHAVAERKKHGFTTMQALATVLAARVSPEDTRQIIETSPLLRELKDESLREMAEQLKIDGVTAQYAAMALKLELPDLLKQPPPDKPPDKPPEPMPVVSANSMPSSRSRPRPVKLPKAKKVKAKTRVLNAVVPLMQQIRPVAAEGYAVHVPETDTVRLKGTNKGERITIAASLLADPTTAIAKERVDGLDASLSLKSKEALFDVGVTFRQVGERRTLATCYFPGGDGGRLRGREAMVLGWCGQVWSWLGMSLPNIQAPILRLVLQQELACDTVETMRWKGQQTVFNTESLWGRFLDLHLLPTLSRAAVDLAKHWNRIAILQSRPVNKEFRDYIIKQYIYPEIGASDDFKANPPRCPIDQYVLKRAADLKGRDVVVDFPTTFDLDATYLRAIPICLAAYPPFAQVEYTGDDGKRYRLMCHDKHDFVTEIVSS